ncbi:MAG: hypothetical protein ACREDR_48270, partial [Blastocatellia bacterium]
AIGPLAVPRRCAQDLSWTGPPGSGFSSALSRQDPEIPQTIVKPLRATVSKSTSSMTSDDIVSELGVLLRDPRKVEIHKRQISSAAGLSR